MSNSIVDLFKVFLSSLSVFAITYLKRYAVECIHAFELLKKKVIWAPIMVSLNWFLPFEYFMCDASNFAIGVILRQRKNNKLHVIYYSSRTLTKTKMNYVTSKKELLAVVFTFDKFYSYLISLKVIAYSIQINLLTNLLAKKYTKSWLLRWILLL